MATLIAKAKYALVYKIARYGITVGGTNYKFGYISNSGLKKSACYIFRDDVDMSCFLLGITPEQFNAHGGILATKEQQLTSRFFTPAMPSDRFTTNGQMLRVSDCWVLAGASIEKNADITRCTPNKKEHKIDVNDENNAPVKDKPFDGEGLVRREIMKDDAQGRPVKGMFSVYDIYDEDLLEVRSGFRGDPEKNDVRKYKAFLDPTMVKEVAFFNTHAEWVHAYIDNGLDEIWFHDIAHEPAVKERRMSRQMLQTIFDVTFEELLEIGGISVANLAYLNSTDGLSDLLKEVDKPFHKKSELAKCCCEIDGIAETMQLIEYAAQKFYGELQDTLAGKPHVRGAYLFAISDPDAMYQMEVKNMPYSKDIGALRAGECATGTFGENELILERSPHINEEATTLKNVGNKFHKKGVVVVNIHDMTARIMALDFDGDHSFVIDNQKLVSVIKRIKEKYGIRPVIFEPLESAADMTVPSDEDGRARRIADMVITCEKYNLVGAYSKKANSLWNSIDTTKMTYDEIKVALEKAAKIACYVNWAVDSSKTYSMMYMEHDLASEFEKGIFSDRYMYASKADFAELMNPSEKTNVEAIKAKIEKMFGVDKCVAKGNATVDRLFDLTTKALKGRMRVNVKPTNEFDWTKLRGGKNAFGVARKPVEPTGTLGKLLIKYWSIKQNSNGDKLQEAIANGEPIGAYDLFKMLLLCKQTLLTEWCSAEEHSHDSYDARQKKAMTSRQLDDTIIDIIVEWTEPSSLSRKDQEFTRNDKIKAFALAVMAHLVNRNGEGFKSTPYMITSALRLFGPVYRANFRMNKAEHEAKTCGKGVL